MQAITRKFVSIIWLHGNTNAVQFQIFIRLLKYLISTITVSTEVVDTMDLDRVHRRLHRRSVVRDFTITALAPTVFYLELLYLQVVFNLRKSCLGIFLASF